MNKIVKETRKIFLEYVKNKSILLRMEKNSEAAVAIKAIFDKSKIRKIKCFINLFEYILSSLPQHKATFLEKIFLYGKNEKDFQIPKSSYYFRLRSYSKHFLSLYY